MAKSIIPQVSFKDIDLTEYGGEGIVRVRGMNSGTASIVSSKLQRLALADGYKLSEFVNNEEELNLRYNSNLILYTVELCSEIEEEDGTFRHLTSFEVENMPPALLMDIYHTSLEMNSFPLVQKNGEELKQEQSKPLSVE